MADLSKGERERLPLAELINLAGDEIIRANLYGARRTEGVMKFVECEVEVGFDVVCEADGKFKLFAVEFGAKGSQTTMHKLKVKYNAMSGDAFQGVVTVESPN